MTYGRYCLKVCSRKSMKSYVVSKFVQDIQWKNVGSHIFCGTLFLTFEKPNCPPGKNKIIINELFMGQISSNVQLPLFLNYHSVPSPQLFTIHFKPLHNDLLHTKADLHFNIKYLNNFPNLFVIDIIFSTISNPYLLLKCRIDHLIQPPSMG